MATMLAVAVTTTLTAGLTVLPGSTQDAQAQGSPCNIDTFDIDAEEAGNNCEFYGNMEIDASTEIPTRELPGPPFCL